MPRRFFIIALAVLALIGIIGISIADFRQDRILSLIDPWADPLGDGYQAINSFYAFGDGGLFGTGLGNSHQKYYYLPLVQNDFIFAIIGEELGLVGALGVVVLFAVLAFSGFFIARGAPDDKGRMIAGTSAMLLGIQAFYNMFCVLGWAPITGKTLPFISAGGTSMITSMILVGFILWVSFHSSKRDSYAQRRDELVIHEGGRLNSTPVRAVSPQRRTKTEVPQRRARAEVFQRRARSGMPPHRVRVETSSHRAKAAMSPHHRARVKAASLSSMRLNRSGMFQGFDESSNQAYPKERRGQRQL